jgi:hypothetical protein
MLLKRPLRHSSKFLLLGQHLWLSNRPLLPPLLQQEALFQQERLHHKQHQTFKQFSQALPHQVKQEDE